jgi:hypothetical protein
MPKNIYPDAHDPLFEDWDRASAEAGATSSIKDVEFLTLAEAAVLVRRDERTLRDWRQAGLLRTHKIGKAKLILAADLLPLLFGGKLPKSNKINNDSSELGALNSPSNGPFDKWYGVGTVDSPALAGFGHPMRKHPKGA